MCLAFQCTACMPFTYINFAKIVIFGKWLAVICKAACRGITKTDKPVADRIDTVLCIKEEEISIELSFEKLGSSMNLYVANAGDSFLEEDVLNPKVEA